MRYLRFVLLCLLIGTISSVILAQSGSLTTTFAGGNGFNGNMFDLEATACLTLTGFDVNVEPGSQTIEIYYRTGGYAGFESNAGAWTLLGSANVTGNGAGVATSVAVGGLTLQPGVIYGLYVTTTGGNMTYTNGATVYDNGALRLTTGVGKSYPFGGTFDPRTWNGTVYYEPCEQVGTGINFVDGRLNRYDAAAPVVVYVHSFEDGYGLVIYDAYTDRHQLLVVTPEQIAATVGVTENTLIASDAEGRVQVYRLSDGIFLVRAPLNNGKVYLLNFAELAPNVAYTSQEAE